MNCFKFTFFLFLSSLFIHANSLAEIICEELPHDVCAFSISSSGKRCLLETASEKDDEVKYQCRTSEVVVERMAGYLESDACLRACGVDRLSVGISSDDLLEPRFTNKLCSPACCHHCPNIVDLFFNLAAGEAGVFLPDLCTAQRKNPRRSMVEFMGESDGASAPISSEESDLAPSSEEAPGPDEESELAPSSEEAPEPSSSTQDSNLAPEIEEAPGPISSEGSTPAPTPQLLGTLGTAVGSALAPAPSPPSVESDSESNSAPTPNLAGVVGSVLGSAPSPSLEGSDSESNSAPPPNLAGVLEAALAPSLQTRNLAPTLGALEADLAPSLPEAPVSKSNLAPALGVLQSIFAPVVDLLTPPPPASTDDASNSTASATPSPLISTPTLPPLKDIPSTLIPSLAP